MTDILYVGDNSKHLNVLEFFDVSLFFSPATSGRETLLQFISAVAKPIALVTMFITQINITQIFYLYTPRKFHKPSIFDDLRGH